ncbi:sensor histidine kinase [Clostridium lundense]|uniref:sensor histidine kinase n=1 Tax=Clostridium lundense TaxID=319475 RepID=UPI000483A235|nr:HAMP domain-containing sensor histidine kinase [Clostridium lundense]
MKSLKVKITLLISSILIVTMGLLTGYSILNSNNQFVNPLIIELSKEPKEPLKREIISNDNKNTVFKNNGDCDKIFITYNVRAAQRSFGYKQIFVMVLMVLGGIVFTYIIISKTLKPLSVLDKTAVEIDVNSLETQIELPKYQDEVYSLTNSFNTMLSRLKIAFQIQKNFAQNAAHELKTPLAVIKSSIQVLELDDNPTVEDYKENLTTVKQSTDDLIQIVGQLLEVTNNVAPQKQEIDIGEVIFQCLSDYESEIEKKSISILMDVKNIKIYSNFSLFKSIISNILSNAIKYNRINGSISVCVYKEGRNVVIVITDTGIGIPSDSLIHIFETFYRVDHSRSKNTVGNGLGLSIVKTACEKLQGDIHINSEVNKGTVVTIGFPMNRELIV